MTGRVGSVFLVLLLLARLYKVLLNELLYMYMYVCMYTLELPRYLSGKSTGLESTVTWV